MSTNLATLPNEQAVITALRDSFYPGAKDSSIAMVTAYCRAAGLDPMTRPVHIVPMAIKNAATGRYEQRDVVMPGIELYRIKADRTGKYAGQDDAEFGPEVEGWGIRFPQWCRVTVYKLTDAGRVSYSARVFWTEAYSTESRDSDAPNKMWKKRPYGQLEKCAEAAALRKAFPEVGGQPTAEEMAGKTLEAHVERDMGAATIVEPDPPPASRTESVKAKLKTRAKPAEPVEPAPDLDDVLSAIAGAETLDALKTTAGLASKLADTKGKATARAAYAARKDALTAPPEALEPQTEQDPTLPGDPQADEAPKPDGAAWILAGITAAQTADLVSDWEEEARLADLTDTERGQIETAAEARRAELTGG
jgi:phage recombination protein Bet